MFDLLGFGSPNRDNVAVDHQSYCGRMGGALQGMCFGFVLFIVSIFLIGWNEFNYVRNQGVLWKVDRETVEAGCFSAFRWANDKPIWASCPVNRLYDFSSSISPSTGLPTFTETVQGAWFQASSQIYQWAEKKSCKSSDTPGGGKTQECTYSYGLQWVSAPIDSNSFYCHPTTQSGCQRGGSAILNQGTIPKILQRTLKAPDGKVGIGGSKWAYILNSGMLGVFGSKPVPVSFSQSSDFSGKKTVVMDSPGGVIQYSSFPGSNSLGDVRTSFTQSDMMLGSPQVSVIAKQAGCYSGSSDASLIPWDTRLSGSMAVVNWAVLGSHSKDEMVSDKESENGTLVLLLRLAGFVLMWFGLQLVTGPVALAPEVLPCVGHFVGRIIGGALCCLNFMLSAALSLTVIATAWLLARPLVGIALFAAAAALVGGAWMLRKQHKGDPRSPQMSEFGSLPLISAAAVVPAVQQTHVQVTCPEGVSPGQMLLVQGPDGRQYNVQVPAGVQPSQQFLCAL
ncbi:unnamed protein product [Polarella glacialis]|uniref:Transmembrane protein n=1 Tax=Polarella glacialis TaxID=89957 RepID=A0A813LAC7_POLGL|nr:unnamed protein product [Polarella glacialis]